MGGKEAEGQAAMGWDGKAHRAEEALEQRKRRIKRVLTAGFCETIGVFIVRGPALQVAQDFERLQRSQPFCNRMAARGSRSAPD